jgi:AIPR protein
MENNNELNEFAAQLLQEIITRTETEGEEQLRAEAFTKYMIESLVEANELEDGTAIYHRTRGVEVSGYNLDDDGTLNLFITIYTQSNPPETIGKNEIDIRFKRLRNFLQKAFTRYYLELEEASEAFDMSEHIFERSNDITGVNLYLFTDGLTTADIIPDEKLNNLLITYRIWDLRRLYRYDSSGKDKEPIHIDFAKPLPCLKASDDGADYSAYLTIIPGNILDWLYDTYGSRLLELNVRSYLQARVKVNQGIRKTIKEQPERFLAYNNGISATASNIEVVPLQEGGLGIKSLDDLQIVNGGQTTASIFYTARKDKADVSRLLVQAKISVVAPKNINDLVPLISRYANSQNKVNEADFSANEPFHVSLEALSRSIWAPAVDGTQRQTKWFYERARGQYQDAITHEVTPARQRQFKEIHPSAQKFTKTDLAKFIMTWEKLPHIVSQGAQKCFTQFTTQLKKMGDIEVNQLYFHHLVAKAIIFRQAEKIVASQKLGGYRANVVTYSLAYIFHHTDDRINLDRIWQQQNIGQGLRKAIEHISIQVHNVIISPPGGKNVTEWCKRAGCWNRVRDLEIDLPTSLRDELLSVYSSDTDSHDDSKSSNSVVAQIAMIPTETWSQLSAWGKETHNLQAQQRDIAIKLGHVRRSGKLPKRKLAEQGLLLLKEAYRLGFKTEPVAI